MKIAIIGTGNVATILGRKIIEAGHKIVQVTGRSRSAASSLANLLQCPYSLSLTMLNQNADIYFICVQDKEIEKVISQISIPEHSTIVHTAGGVSIELLATKFKNYGVVYPLQSLRKQSVSLPEIPFFIDANSERNIEFLMQFAGTISNKVARAKDEQRIKLHVAAVFVSNFTNYLYCLADDFSKKENIDFQFLQPLIEETAKRLKQFNPNEMQTGPAVRGDEPTIKKHLALLSEFEEAKNVYRFLSKKIQNHFGS